MSAQWPEREALTPAVLACEGVSVRLGGVRVLDGVSARLRPREVTAIVGPNGAGKSTWLSVLAGLRRPDAGAATLGEAEVRALPPRERALRIGLLPQTPEVAWSVDVETLVGLGRLPHTGARGLAQADRRAVAAALQTCGLTAFARRRVDTLSGGERARVLLARVLAGEPEWLLADEPLAGLDPGQAMDMAERLARFAEDGRGVVMTVHDLGFAARWADRVVVLGPGGRVLADAAPLEAMSPTVLAEAYGVDARWDATPGAPPVLHLLGRLASHDHQAPAA